MRNPAFPLKQLLQTIWPTPPPPFLSGKGIKAEALFPQHLSQTPHHSFIFCKQPIVYQSTHPIKPQHRQLSALVVSPPRRPPSCRCLFGIAPISHTTSRLPHFFSPFLLAGGPAFSPGSSGGVGRHVADKWQQFAADGMQKVHWDKAADKRHAAAAANSWMLC